LGVLSLYLLCVPGEARENRRAIEAHRTPDESESVAVHFPRDTTAERDVVITDEPMLALLAGRSIVPTLTEVSWKRLRTGDLSPEQMIRLTEQRQPAAIVIWKERFQDSAYDAWVRSHYYLGHLDSSSHRIYLRSPELIPADRWLGDWLRLLGYNYDVDRSHPDEPRIRLTLFWRPVSAEGEAKLDLEVIDDGGKAWGGTSGAFSWAPEMERTDLEFIPDARMIGIRPDTPPGRYRVSVAYTGSDGEPDELVIGPIDIPAR
jgi:hypothetical protein